MVDDDAWREHDVTIVMRAWDGSRAEGEVVMADEPREGVVWPGCGRSGADFVGGKDVY